MILFFAVIVAAAIILLQYSSYAQQRDKLLEGSIKSRQQLNQIVNVLPRREAFTEQLNELKRRHDALRQQIPAEPQLDTFQRGLEEMLKAKGLEVRADRAARLSRPFYQELRLSYSIKGSVSSVQQVYTELQKQPRVVIGPGPARESFESTGLVFSIFSAPPKGEERIVVPECLAAQEGVWLPLLTDKLASLYDNYVRTCRAVIDNGELFRDIQRYRYLSEEVQFLETVRSSITGSN
jgi:hypothetical protein